MKLTFIPKESDVQKMSDVLEDLDDWETLTDCLDITRSAIDNINKNCPSYERAQCQWRELVKTYCADKIPSGDPYEAAAGIASSLHYMKRESKAQTLKELHFCTTTTSEFYCNSTLVYRVI